MSETKRILKYLAHQKIPVTTRAISEDSGIPVNRVRLIMAVLFDSGIVMRDKVPNSNEYVYWMGTMVPRDKTRPFVVTNEMFLKIVDNVSSGMGEEVVSAGIHSLVDAIKKYALGEDVTERDFDKIRTLFESYVRELKVTINGIQALLNQPRLWSPQEAVEFITEVRAIEDL